MRQNISLESLFHFLTAEFLHKAKHQRQPTSFVWFCHKSHLIRDGTAQPNALGVRRSDSEHGTCFAATSGPPSLGAFIFSLPTGGASAGCFSFVAGCFSLIVGDGSPVTRDEESVAGDVFSFAKEIMTG